MTQDLLDWKSVQQERRLYEFYLELLLDIELLRSDVVLCCKGCFILIVVFWP